MKKGWRVFWIVYINVVIILVIAWAFTIIHVRNVLKDYEWSQPQRGVERLVEKLQEGSASRLFSFRGEASKFESEEEIKEIFMERIKGKKLSYQLIREGISPVTQLYAVYADEEKVAEVQLEESAEEPVLIFLTKGYWSLESVEGYLPMERNNVDLTLPDIYEVSVNGVVLGEDEYASMPKEIKQFQYSKEYVPVPQMVHFLISGLVGEPQIEIKDIHGEVVDLDFFLSEKSEDKSELFVEAEISDELSDMVLTNAKRYANFFTKDLEGAKQSVKPIEDMFPEDSYYLKLADEYRKHDMWMYNAHEAPVFSNESVTHYTEYAEDFFSCEVYFDREMKLAGSKTNRKDYVKTKFYYGKIQGEWKIVDLETLVENEASEQ